MNYKFNVTLTDKDYLDFNIFWMIKSPYGKKQMMKLRLVLLALFVAGGIAILLLGDNSAQTYMSVCSLAVMLVLFQLFMARFMAWSLKGQLKTMKKSGRLAYSPRSVMEFYEDYFVESTDENRNEQKYSGIERISVISGKINYIHINNTMAYLLPVSSFATAEECRSFIEFMKTKVPTVDIY